jgi:hypothetical protein
MLKALHLGSVELEAGCVRVRPIAVYFQALWWRKIDYITLTRTRMAPSASKQKRLAEKAAKKSAGINGGDVASTSTSTPAGSVNGGSTPLTSVSAANSTDDLSTMAKLNLATER